MSWVCVAGSPTSSNFSVIDFDNPNNPITRTPNFRGACQVKQDGTFAYVGNLLGGEIQQFDIASPATPVANGTANTRLGGIGVIAIRGSLVAVGEATNTFKARICLIDFSSRTTPRVLGTAQTPLVSVATSPTDTLAAISSLAFINPVRLVASGPAGSLIAVADFTNPGTPTVTTYNPHAGPPCLDADVAAQRIVTGDTNASWVRLYDAGWNLLTPIPINTTLNSVDNINLAWPRALAGSNNTFHVAAIDFGTNPPKVVVFDPQLGGGSCTAIKGAIGCCGGITGTNVKLFNLATDPPLLLASANPHLGAVGSIDLSSLAAAISTTPTRLDFGIERVSTQKSLTLTVHNAGTVGLNVSNLHSTSPVFSVSPIGLTVGAGTSGSLTVRFVPNAKMKFGANLMMQTNDPEHVTFAVPLTGTGM
jgi:hypothetical protein